MREILIKRQVRDQVWYEVKETTTEKIREIQKSVAPPQKGEVQEEGRSNP